MKRINKSMSPNSLTLFADNNPYGSWDDFRHNNAGHDYSTLKELIFSDQGGICSYCETSVNDGHPHKRRIEHYHSKSDNSTLGVNWALDWTNIFGVCLGGSDKKSDYPLPGNLSCDAHKAYLEDKNKLSKQCEGYILNPLDIIANPTLFDFNKATGELIVNSSACTLYVPQNNNFSTVDELVDNTIKAFNLNCNRLTAQRLKIFHYYQHKINRARKINDTQVYSKLADM